MTQTATESAQIPVKSVGLYFRMVTRNGCVREGFVCSLSRNLCLAPCDKGTGRNWVFYPRMGYACMSTA